MIRVPNIPFCPLRWSRCRLSAACFERVYFFAVFVVPSAPMPASRLSPTDRYDGDAQMRKSSAGALHRGAAPVPFRQLFCCAGKDRFCSCHHIHVQRLMGR